MRQYVHKILGFFLVAVRGIQLRAVWCYTPAIFPVKAFSPPAIEYAQVEYSVYTGFLSRCAAGFQWVFRCIQPYIYTCYQFTCQGPVVAFQQ